MQEFCYNLPISCARDADNIRARGNNLIGDYYMAKLTKPRAKKSIEERFFAKTKLSEINSWNGTPCLEWQGYCDSQTYGILTHNGKNWKAHRFVMIITGFELGDLCVCHHCDNRKCVNVTHLFLGTKADNAADMIAKGRRSSTSGEKNGRAKLKSADIPRICQMREEGMEQKAIAEAFGVVPSVISSILRGKLWAAKLTAEQ
jgi:hypothetical protein